MIELLAKHQPDAEVARADSFRPARTVRNLLEDAAQVAARLPEVEPQALACANGRPKARNQVLLVFRQDRYAFAAALLGAWSRGYTVCLPPNQRAQTVLQVLAHDSVYALLHDTEVGGHLSVPSILAAPPTAPALTRVSVPDTAATVMTSGTTGDSHAWPKTAQQLLGEVAVLARSFGLTEQLSYVITVPPSHLYGLLFGVLLPLATGSAFCRSTPLLPGEIAATVANSGAEVLISVPTHLRVARSIDPQALASLRWVFSSAGPLDEATAQMFSSIHQQPIIEIFGSTETGGIAWRRRQEQTEWRPFAEVEVSLGSENRLVVRSAFANSTSSEQEAGFETADQVRLNADGTFAHLGRQDGVVKIGGQRVSLPAMEACLMQHPSIEDAAVLALPQASRGHRLLAAVVAPPGLEQACRAHLSQHFAESTLPRRFLFLSRLPRESNGKLMRSQLLRLFGFDDQGHAMDPKVVFDNIESSAATALASVTIPMQYVAYSGHFDVYPVLAGAVQLEELVLPLVRRERPEWPALRELRQVKFTGRIEPGDNVQVQVQFREHRCLFDIRKQAKLCASGELVFAGPGSDG